MGKEVITFGKELAVLEKIVSAAEEKRLSDAYDWAMKRWRELGLVTQPVHLVFENGDYVDDGDGYTIAIFYKKATGEALLCRYWEDEMTIGYNLLTNYDEVAEVAPNSLKLMLQNGLKIKQRLEAAY